MSTIKNGLRMFDKFTGHVDKVVKNVIALALMIMFSLLLLSVLSRYVIAKPFFWLTEGAAYLGVLVAMWGSASALRSSKHMQVNIIADRFKKIEGDKAHVLRAILNIVIYIIMIYYLSVLMNAGWKFAMFGQFEMSPSGYIRVFYARLIIPTGAFLMILQSLTQIARALLIIIEMHAKKKNM